MTLINVNELAVYGWTAKISVFFMCIYFGASCKAVWRIQIRFCLFIWAQVEFLILKKSSYL